MSKKLVIHITQDIGTIEEVKEPPPQIKKRVIIPRNRGGGVANLVRMKPLLTPSRSPFTLPQGGGGSVKPQIYPKYPKLMIRTSKIPEIA